MKASKIALNRASEIKDLFGQIASLQLTALERAFRIGELFMEQKAECGHGEWLPWLAEHFPANANGKGGISPQSAAQYIRVYENREKLRSKMIESFSDARKYLAEHSTKGNKHQSKKPPSEKQRDKLEKEQIERERWIAEYVSVCGLTREQAEAVANVNRDHAERAKREQKKKSERRKKEREKERDELRKKGKLEVRMIVPVNERLKEKAEKKAKAEKKNYPEWVAAIIAEAVKR